MPRTRNRVRRLRPAATSHRSLTPEVLESRLLLTYSDAGGPYTIQEGEALAPVGNPANFTLISSGVGNSGLTQNEIEIDPTVVDILNPYFNTSITGAFKADLVYSGSTLSSVKFLSGDVIFTDHSASDSNFLAGISITFSGVRGILYSTDYETVTPDAFYGGSIAMTHTHLVLNQGVITIDGSGLANSVNSVVNLNTNPADLGIGQAGRNATLSVNGSYLGTLEYEIPRNTDIITFLSALLSPEDLAQIQQYVSGTFGFDVTGQGDLTQQINANAYTYTWDINGDGNYTDASGLRPTLSWSQLNALGINDGPASYNVRLRTDDGVSVITSPVSPLTVNNTPPSANSGGPYTIAKGNPLTLLGSGSDPGPIDNPVFSWDLNGDSLFGDALGASPTVSWAQLQALGITAAGAWNATLRVTDKDGGTTNAPTTLTVVDSVPVASAGGAYSMPEGSSLQLDATATTDADLPYGDVLTYSWDVNGDGTFGDATGVNPVLSWSQLVALNINDGPAVIPNLALRVTDVAGNLATATTSLTVNNVAPSVAGITSSSSTANRGASVLYTLTATDASAVDQAYGFTFYIDWDGDGTDDQSHFGHAGVTLFHTYPVHGTYTQRVRAVDKDGGTSPVGTRTMQINRGSLNAQGSETAVNTTITGDQTAPAVANDLFGNYIVAWVDSAKDGVGNGSGVYAKVLNNTGGTVFAEFRVNTTLGSNQDQPAVAMDQYGNFIVVWRSGQNVGNDIYAKVYNRFGQVVRDEFLVNSGYVTDNQAQPSVAVDANGNFVVVWQSNLQDTSGFGVYGQRYNAAGVAQGSMFRANVLIDGNQDRPRVDMDDAGNFVVAWRSLAQDGSGQGVYERRFNAAGVALDAADVRVNTTTAGDQTDPSVALDAAGNFVISWTSANQDGSGNGIYAQRFSAAGVKQGGEIAVNTTTANNQQLSVVQSDAFGDFVVAWESNLQDGSGLGVYYRKFTAAGAPLTAEVRINTTTTGDQKSVALTANGDGDVVAAWQAPDAAGQGVFAQRYNFIGVGNSLPTASAGGPYTLVEGQTLALNAVASDANNDRLWYRWDLNGDGSFGDVVGQSSTLTWQQLRDLNLSGVNFNALPQSFNVAVRVNDGTGGSVTSANTTLTIQPAPSLGSESRVNVTTAGSQEAPAIASDAAGNYVVVWESPDATAKGVFARRYLADGTPAGSEFAVNTSYTSGDQFRPSVSMNASGSFVILWQSFGQDGNGFGIRGRRYDSAGNLVGSEFAVNSTTFDNQVRPVVKLRDDGTFVAAWQSYGQDGSQHGIYTQRFDSSNAPLTAETAVNQFTTGFQEFPKLAMDASGNYVITWTSGSNPSGDNDGQGIYARRFDANGTPNGNEFQVNTYTTQNQFKSVVAMDSSGAFVVAWTDVVKDGNANGIFARRYNASGTAIDAAEFQVNAFTSGLQQLPSVAMDAAGNWVIAYESQNQDGSDFGIYARTYTASGSLETAEFRVNQTTANAQTAAAVTLAPSGQFVVAWQSTAQDGDQGGIYTRRFQHAGVGGGGFAPQRLAGPSGTDGDTATARRALLDALFARLAAQRDGDDDLSPSFSGRGAGRAAARQFRAAHDAALNGLF